MADTKVSALTTVAAPAATDVFYLVDDPGGTPVSGKATVWTCVMAGLVVPAAASGAGSDYRWKGQDAATGAGGDLILEPGEQVTSGADGVVIVRQPGGVAGTDDLELSHNGTDALLESKSGDVIVIPAGGQVILRQPGGVAGTDDLELSHDGTNAILQSKSGDVIVNPAGGQVILRQPGGVAGTDDLELSHDGTDAIVESKSGDIIAIPAGGQVILRQPGGVAGTDDLELSHNGTDAILQSKSGDIIAVPAGGEFIIRQPGGSAGTAEGRFSHDGYNTLYDNRNSGSGGRHIFQEAGTHAFAISTGSDTAVGTKGVNSNGFWVDGQVVTRQYFFTGGSGVDAGFARVGAGVVSVTNGSTGGGALLFTEQTAPSAPATNTVVIYAEDTGGGKTRLVARFPTGAAQVIATEP